MIFNALPDLPEDEDDHFVLDGNGVKYNSGLPSIGGVVSARSSSGSAAPNEKTYKHELMVQYDEAGRYVGTKMSTTSGDPVKKGKWLDGQVQKLKSIQVFDSIDTLSNAITEPSAGDSYVVEEAVGVNEANETIKALSIYWFDNAGSSWLYKGPVIANALYIVERDAYHSEVLYGYDDQAKQFYPCMTQQHLTVTRVDTIYQSQEYLPLGEEARKLGFVNGNNVVCKGQDNQYYSYEYFSGNGADKWVRRWPINDQMIICSEKSWEEEAYTRPAKTLYRFNLSAIKFEDIGYPTDLMLNVSKLAEQLINKQDILKFVDDYVEDTNNEQNNNLVATQKTVNSTIAREVFEKANQGNGVLVLNEEGRIPMELLPSNADVVKEYTDKSKFPKEGEQFVIYYDKSTQKSYKWGFAEYIEIVSTIAVGTNENDAFSGSRGVALENTMTHHLDTEKNPNPHRIDAAILGLEFRTWEISTVKDGVVTPEIVEICVRKKN